MLYTIALAPWGVSLPLLCSSETPKQLERRRGNELEGGGRKVLMELECMSVFIRTSHIRDLLLLATARQEQGWQPRSDGQCAQPLSSVGSPAVLEPTAGWSPQ